MLTAFSKALLQESETPFLNQISNQNPQQKLTRLQVYRNNVFVSLIDALEEIFPVTKEVVGSDFFRAVARLFVADHPPTSPVLSQYGDRFPRFLRNFPPAQALPYLADLADFEYQRLQLTHHVEGEPLPLGEVQQRLTLHTDPEQLRLRFCRSVTPFQYQSAAPSIWEWHQLKPEQRTELSVATAERGIFYKQGLYANHQVLSAAEFDLFNGLAGGLPLINAYQNIQLAPNSDESLDLGGFLAKVIQLPIIEEII